MQNNNGFSTKVMFCSYCETKVYEDDRLCPSCGAPLATVKVKEKQFPEMEPVEMKQEKLVAPISIGNGLNVSGRVDEKTDKWVWDVSEDGKEILTGASKQEFDKYMIERNEILFPYKEMPKKKEEESSFRYDIPISENKGTIWNIIEDAIFAEKVQ